MKKVTLILVLLSIAFLFVGCVDLLQQDNSDVFQSYFDDLKNITENSSITVLEKYFYNVNVTGMTDFDEDAWEWAIEELIYHCPIYDGSTGKVTGKIENLEITNEKESEPPADLKNICPDVEKVLTADLSFDLTAVGETTSKHYDITRSAYYIKDRWYIGVVYYEKEEDKVVIYPDWEAWEYWGMFLGEFDE
ncbi:hypothetical protein XO10_05285 [Marinitoga sp. 1135]|uniref:Lipoprotein n=1 Tax=Marinitoga piezophila (strain DSM 14283 / JCM 11233 / KA3) TaxID=443254 RepID=H2J7Y9_MARPK|nr:MULTISPECIES: hypothetical protein [Marinitoga]AEX85480.1 hypothetical protein Marpi_1068 [Marinitoga piezophila KA3]NUU95693.1 hypothetical protein [Marinitoga sp. 1135]NUU97625.1 hypothetical protein [Marinitoga sp. 1138]